MESSEFERAALEARHKGHHGHPEGYGRGVAAYGAGYGIMPYGLGGLNNTTACSPAQFDGFVDQGGNGDGGMGIGSAGCVGGDGGAGAGGVIGGGGPSSAAGPGGAG